MGSLFTKYRLVREASRVRQDSGHLIQWDIAVHAVAKADTSNPYLVVNEFLASKLGELAGVPVVHGIVVSGVTREGRRLEQPETLHWASLSVGEDLPDADPDDAIRQVLPLACASIVFDIWIANPDRHERNFSYDADRLSLLLFDHGESLCNCVGPSYLATRRNSLGLNGVHALSRVLTNPNPLMYWVERIQRISPDVIASIVDSAVEVGLPSNEAKALTIELVLRQRRLMYLIHSNLSSTADFPKLQPNMCVDNLALAHPTPLLIEDDYDDFENGLWI